jgi:hypothetical protein
VDTPCHSGLPGRLASRFTVFVSITTHWGPASTGNPIPLVTWQVMTSPTGMTSQETRFEVANRKTRDGGVATNGMTTGKRFRWNQARMERSIHGLPNVLPGLAMPDTFTPCRRATPEMALRPFWQWPACRAGGLQPSSTPLVLGYPTPYGPRWNRLLCKKLSVTLFRRQQAPL